MTFRATLVIGPLQGLLGATSFILVYAVGEIDVRMELQVLRRRKFSSALY